MSANIKLVSHSGTVLDYVLSVPVSYKYTKISKMYVLFNCSTNQMPYDFVKKKTNLVSIDRLLYVQRMLTQNVREHLL